MHPRRAGWLAGFVLSVVVAVAVAGAGVAHAGASAVADFYRGKTVTVIVGYSAGGGYDLYARVLARHIGRHIPGNPTVIVQNMPGAGSMISANHLFNVASKDGTVFGIFARGLPLEQLLGNQGVQFEAARFNWIGSMNEEVSVCVARTDSGIRRFEDVLSRPLLIGGTGPGADTDVFPTLLNGVLGAKFNLVAGYPGGNDINLAIERNEVQGRCGWSWSSVKSTRPDWLEQKLIVVLIQMALRKHPDMPDVPLVMDYARDEDTRQIFEAVFARQTMGRPFAAPPGIPAERVAALRRAFVETLKDPQFLTEARQADMEINNPMSGDELQALVERIARTPARVVRLIDQYL